MARRHRRPWFLLFYNGRKRRRHVLPYILIILVVLAGALILIDIKLRPLVTTMAVSRAKILAMNAINDAINEEISDQNIKYEDLVEPQRNDLGQITALQTNMVKINMLKSMITQRILEKIQDIKYSQLNIPLGNIINGDLFSGRGPKIPISLVPYGIVTATFKFNFVTAGINQTRHQILLVANVQISVIMPGGRGVSSEVESEVSIAETIIVGTVPESYTYIEDPSDDTLEKYNNYKE